MAATEEVFGILQLIYIRRYLSISLKQHDKRWTFFDYNEQKKKNLNALSNFPSCPEPKKTLVFIDGI